MDFKKLRKEKKLSQAETAKLLKIQINTWVNWERGCGQPSPGNLKKIEILMTEKVK